MIKIDINKVCRFSLLCANLYSPSGLFCFFWLLVPSSPEVDWPLRTLREHWDFFSSSIRLGYVVFHCCADLYSQSGLLCYFLVASPIERRSRLAIENIEKAIYEVIVPLPLPLLLRPHFIQIGPTFLCPRFLYTSMLWIFIHPDILMFTLYHASIAMC